jgi:apolipoprotein N-acyltransferase
VAPWLSRVLSVGAQHPGLLTGVLVGTSNVPFVPWAILVCWIPLWAQLRRPLSWTTAFQQAWLSQFVLSLMGFSWLGRTVQEHGGLSWPLSVAVLLVFAGTMHLHIPIAFTAAAVLTQRFHLGLRHAFLVAALLHALAERVWPMLFPWHMGYTLLWAGIPAFQWADTIGFSGLSTLLLVANGWLGGIWLTPQTPRLMRRRLAVFAGFLVTLVGTGHLKGRQAIPGPEAPRVTLLAVQSNSGRAARLAGASERPVWEQVLATTSDLTARALVDTTTAAADVIVWPEVAIPAYLRTRGQGVVVQQALRAVVAEWQRPVLTGAWDQHDAQHHNALFVIDSAGHLADPPYAKSRLLPFGEYVPRWAPLPWLAGTARAGLRPSPGPGPHLLVVPTRAGPLAVGPQICYEGLFPALSRSLGDQGAQLLVNVANDSWFGDSFAVRQHLIVTLARGIEIRRPVLRVTNTGITTAMDAAGRMYARSPVARAWFGSFTLPYQHAPSPTVWQRVGHWDWVLWLLLLLGILWHAHRKHRRVALS